MSGNIGEGKYVISVDNSGAITQLNRFEQQVKTTTRNTEVSFRQAAASAVSLASGVGSLYFQYDNLEKVQLRIRKASLEVSRSQELVNKLVSEGKTGTLDYQQALEKLSIAEERHRILSDDLKESQIALGFSIAQTALTIPSAITAIKGLTSATSVLNMANSKFILIALAVIAAYEGITQAIKYFNKDLDFTLSGAINRMTNGIDVMKDSTNEGSASFAVYGSTISGVGASASATTGSLGTLNREIDLTNGKIENLKKNEDSLAVFIGETYSAIGNMIAFADALNDQALKQKMIQFEREFERKTEERNQSYLASLDKNSPGFTDANAGLWDRNIVGRGMTGKQFRVLSHVSKQVSDVFRRIALGGGGGYSNIHGNLQRMTGIGGISQESASVYAQSLKFRGTNPFGSIGSRANQLGGISVSIGAKGKSSKHGGFKRGWGTQEVIRPFNEQTASYQAISDYYRNLGFDIDVPKYGLDYMIRGIKSPSNEFLQNAIHGATNNYNLAVARFNQQIENAKAEIENRILGLASRSGLTRSQVVTMQTTQQGTDDLYGIIDYRERLARASTGSG